jgi:methanogenic corrinoid protein MtbC1
MLLYRQGRFFQWLEGPKEAVDAVWASIRADERHRDIVVFQHSPVAARLFSSWNMRMFVKKDEFDANGAVRRNRMNDTELTDYCVDLLAKFRTESVIDLFSQYTSPNASIVAQLSNLSENVSHRLGDLWYDDRYSSFDITVSLACLQLVSRRILFSRAISATRPQLGQTVLVCSQPKADQVLGVMFVAEHFHSAGWDDEVIFPESISKITEAVRNNHYDVLCLMMSDVFEHKDRIPELERTIREVRSASVNTAIIIAAGGRAFLGTPNATARAIGADVGFPTANETVESARFVLSQRRTLSFEDSRPTGEDAELRLPKLPEGWFWVR